MIEHLLIAGARMIRDKQTVFAGFHWPLLISILAKKLHAPRSRIVVEGGLVIDEIPRRIPSSTTDTPMALRSILWSDSITGLGIFLPKVDIAFLTTSSIDKFGNLNTTCIGTYNSPVLRLPGGGGGPDVSTLAKKLVVVLDKHEKRRFPLRVDFITSPAATDLTLLTPLGIFRWRGKEIALEEIFPGVSPKQVKNATGWKFKKSKKLRRISPPTTEEMRATKEILSKAEKSFWTIRK
jgi:glutaconate CoA-transferase subunit B